MNVSIDETVILVLHLASDAFDSSPRPNVKCKGCVSTNIAQCLALKLQNLDFSPDHYELKRAVSLMNQNKSLKWWLLEYSI